MALNRDNRGAAEFDAMGGLPHRSKPNTSVSRPKKAPWVLVKAKADIAARSGDAITFGDCRVYDIDSYTASTFDRDETAAEIRVGNPYIVRIRQNAMGLAIPIGSRPGFFLWNHFTAPVAMGKVVNNDMLASGTGQVELYDIDEATSTGVTVTGYLRGPHGGENISVGKWVIMAQHVSGIWLVIAAECESAANLQVGD